MIQSSVHGWARFVAVGVVVVAICLSAAACGRKGPLDPPPGAAQYSQPAPASPAQLASPDGQVGVGPDGKALAPPPSKQRQPFILDWLVE